MFVVGKKWLYSGKLFVFGQKWLYSGKSGFIRAKALYSSKSGGIRAKVVAFREFRANVVVLAKTGCIRTRWLYSGKVVVFGQK